MTDKTMVDRVARALFDGSNMGGQGVSFDDQEFMVREVFKTGARQAIAAMRGPTAAMLDFDCAAEDVHGPLHAWHLMIDAALKEGK